MLLAAVGAGSAAAQTPHQIRLDVAASHARPPAGVVADAQTYLTGALHWLHAGRVVAFSGVGGGLATAANADGWISAYAGVRAERLLRPSLQAGLTGSAVGFRLDRPDAYRVAALRLEPELRFGAGPTFVTVQLHGGLGAVRSEPGGDMVSETLWSAGGALLVEHVIGRARARARAAAYEAPAGTFLSGGGAVETQFGDVRVEVEASAWSAPPAGTLGAVQLRVDVPLARVLSAVSAAGRSDPDPLLGTAAGGYASAGLQWDVLATLAPPPPATIEVRPASGTVRFTVAPGQETSQASGDDDGVAVVELLGDFNAWQPVPLREVEPGRWRVELPVPPGVHHFVFRVDGVLWLPADAPGRALDEWGRPTATLVVPGA